MKVILFIFFSMAGICLSQNETARKCPMFNCSSDIYDPVCGKQEKGGCWEERIFQSECFMHRANSCGKANYVPCVDNKCPAEILTTN